MLRNLLLMIEIYTRLMNDITATNLWNKYNSIDKNIAKKIQNLGYLSRLIKTYLQGYYEYYGGFSKISNNEQINALISNMLKDVLNYLDTQIEVNSLKKINESGLLNRWVNQILYKPGGIRYEKIKLHYESLVLEN